MKVFVCLLTHNLSALTLECLDHLQLNTKYPYRLVWIDNGSRHEEITPVQDRIEQVWEDAIIDGFQENKFYAKGTNRGMAIAAYEHDPEYVVCLSNDVFVSPGWLEKMVALMDSNPSYGVLSPMTDNISGGANYKRHYTGMCTPEHLNAKPPRAVPYKGNVALFCGMIRTETIRDVGYLHEEFYICGNDDDYNDRVRLSGRTTGIALNVFVEHKHSATKNIVFPDRTEIKEKHRKLLELRRLHRIRTGDYKA